MVVLPAAREDEVTAAGTETVTPEETTPALALTLTAVGVLP